MHTDMDGVRQNKIANKIRNAILLILLTFTSIVMSWMIPPMQSPDETSHISRAYLLSNGQIMLDEADPALEQLKTRYAKIPGIHGIIERTLDHSGGVGGWVDAGLLEYIDAYGILPGTGFKMPTESEKNKISNIEWSNQLQYYMMPGTNYYIPLIYTPHALGILIGRALKLTIESTYRITRFVVTLAGLYILMQSYSMMTPSPLLFALLLMPMSIFQILSPTIDGLTTSLAVLSLSLYSNILKERNKGVNYKCIALVLCIFVVVTSRNHTMPMLALPIYEAWRNRSRSRMAIGLLAIALTLGWTTYVLGSTNDQRLAHDFTSAEVLKYYIQNPKQLMVVLNKTFSNAETLDFYSKSFLGVLGAFEISLSEKSYGVLWAGVFISLALSVDKKKVFQDIQGRLLMIAVSLLSGFIIFLAMLITWTPHPATIVTGIQGRYFIIPTIILAVALGGTDLYSKKVLGRMRVAAVIVFAITSVFIFSESLLSYYWKNP